MARLSILLAGATALLATFAAFADSYVVVHPGSECTETPHVAGGMYGSATAGQDYLGYWNDGDPWDTEVVFCPVGMLTALSLEEYDWDSETRVSSSPIRSSVTTFPEGSSATVRAWLTKNTSWTEREYCWVVLTYFSTMSGGTAFDWATTPPVWPAAGFNLLSFDLTDLWSPYGYATLVCRMPGVDQGTGLPSQIAGYTLEVVE